MPLKLKRFRFLAYVILASNVPAQSKTVTLDFLYSEITKFDRK